METTNKIYHDIAADLAGKGWNAMVVTGRGEHAAAVQIWAPAATKADLVASLMFGNEIPAAKIKENGAGVFLVLLRDRSEIEDDKASAWASGFAARAVATMSGQEQENPHHPDLPEHSAWACGYDNQPMPAPDFGGSKPDPIDEHFMIDQGDYQILGDDFSDLSTRLEMLNHSRTATPEQQKEFIKLKRRALGLLEQLDAVIEQMGDME